MHEQHRADGVGRRHRERRRRRWVEVVVLVVGGLDVEPRPGASPSAAKRALPAASAAASSSAGSSTTASSSGSRTRSAGSMPRRLIGSDIAGGGALGPVKPDTIRANSASVSMPSSTSAPRWRGAAAGRRRRRAPRPSIRPPRARRRRRRRGPPGAGRRGRRDVRPAPTRGSARPPGDRWTVPGRPGSRPAAAGRAGARPGAGRRRPARRTGPRAARCRAGPAAARPVPVMGRSPHLGVCASVELTPWGRCGRRRTRGCRRRSPGRRGPAWPRGSCSPARCARSWCSPRRRAGAAPTSESTTWSSRLVNSRIGAVIRPSSGVTTRHSCCSETKALSGVRS